MHEASISARVVHIQNCMLLLLLLLNEDRHLQDCHTTSFRQVKHDEPRTIEIALATFHLDRNKEKYNLPQDSQSAITLSTLPI